MDDMEDSSEDERVDAYHAEDTRKMLRHWSATAGVFAVTPQT